MTKKSSGGSSGNERGLHVRVKTAKRRTTSSTRWLQRQLNDPYVVRARKEGWRSRAAFKLLELDEKFHFLKPGKTVIDLGAAPGGWTQVAVEKTKAMVIGIDLKEIDSIPDATLVVSDFMDDNAPEKLKALLHGPVDIVLSDMAPNASGQPSLDHLRIMTLCEAAFDFACEVLAPGGVFIAKVLQGGTESQLLARMRQNFTQVKHAKPKASRADSAESYVVAIGFKSND